MRLSRREALSGGLAGAGWLTLGGLPASALGDDEVDVGDLAGKTLNLVLRYRTDPERIARMLHRVAHIGAATDRRWSEHWLERCSTLRPRTPRQDRATATQIHPTTHPLRPFRPARRRTPTTSSNKPP